MMDNVDLDVLRAALAWRRDGHGVRLYMVIETWGSAPRQPGAMLALRGDGVVVGSVSGGCIEDDLIERQASGRITPVEQAVAIVTYGFTAQEASRFGLPCGGTLRLTEERIDDCAWLEELVKRCESHRVTVRELNLQTGEVLLHDAGPDDAFHRDDAKVRAVYGPRWRLMMIGAGQLSRYVADMALMLGFEVLVCDPRSQFAAEWPDMDVRWIPGMPDDAVLAVHPDERTAIVTLSHDPRLDDMALLTALKSKAFYVGAIGSRKTSARRREYLAELGLQPHEIARLHGPIGIDIGSYTPVEIALSFMAELVALKNGLAGQAGTRLEIVQAQPAAVAASA